VSDNELVAGGRQANGTLIALQLLHDLSLDVIVIVIGSDA
jgi:hypothetical protein